MRVVQGSMYMFVGGFCLKCTEHDFLLKNKNEESNSGSSETEHATRNFLYGKNGFLPYLAIMDK